MPKTVVRNRIQRAEAAGRADESIGRRCHGPAAPHPKAAVHADRAASRSGALTLFVMGHDLSWGACQWLVPAAFISKVEPPIRRKLSSFSAVGRPARHRNPSAGATAGVLVERRSSPDFSTGTGTSTTGMVELRRMRSASLPIVIRPRPRRPCEPRTMSPAGHILASVATASQSGVETLLYRTASARMPRASALLLAASRIC